MIVARKLREQFIQQTGFAARRKNRLSVLANSWSGFRRNIHFSTENPPCSPPISSPWIPAQALVHIAPGHGEDDYWLGRANGLEILSPVDDHGRFTDEASLPSLTGKYVFDANADIINLLRERRMLLAAQKFHHSYPYCWRSKTPIIFRNVEQFFIRIDELRGQGA